MPNQWFLCSPETDHDNSKPGMISIPPIFMTRYGKSVKMDVYGIGFTTLNCIDMVVFSRFWWFFRGFECEKKAKNPPALDEIVPFHQGYRAQVPSKIT